MPVLDKDSQLQQILAGIRSMMQDPSAHIGRQLERVFTDPTTDALPLMGFRIPGAMGQEAVKRATSVMDAINTAREEVGMEPTLFGQRVPRMPFQSAPTLEGGRATAPGIDAAIQAVKETTGATISDEAAARLSNNILQKMLKERGFESLNREALVRALSDLRESLGSQWTNSPIKY